MTATPAPAPEPTAKKKRRDAYVARITVHIPLDMADADSLAGAIKTTKAFEATLPAGSTCDIVGSLGKM